MISAPQEEKYPQKLSNRLFLTDLTAVKKILPPYDSFVAIHRLPKRKKDFVMKKLIALGIALAMLLFTGVSAKNEVNLNTLSANDGIQVCEDIRPDSHLHN